MIWASKKADQRFSQMILRRDRVCVRCKMKPATDCSHYWKRDCSGTRFDPRNADGVDRECHQYWETHRDEYKAFKWKQLGWSDYLAIQRMSAIVSSREGAIIRFMKTQGEKI